MGRDPFPLIRTLGGGGEEDRESVRIKRVEFRENVRGFFPQGQSKPSVITGCPYKALLLSTFRYSLDILSSSNV